MSITDWAARIGIDNKTLEMRFLRGWSVERALTESLGIGRSTSQIGTKKPGCGWFGDSERHALATKKRYP